MAITKIHAIKSTLSKAILYIENPDKTAGQALVSGYNTEPQTASFDFAITAAMVHKAKSFQNKRSGNLAYHLIQSFSPEDAVTPELAHELGRKLAMEFTEGKFEFVVATHVDKDSIHNHIIINAVSFYDYKNCARFLTVPHSKFVASRIGFAWRHSCLSSKILKNWASSTLLTCRKNAQTVTAPKSAKD